MVKPVKDFRPCPSCGAGEVSVSDMLRLAYSEHLSDEDKSRLSNRYCVRCESSSGNGCYCMTPAFDSEEEAIEYWNTPMKSYEAEIQIGGDIDAIKAMSTL